MEAEAITPGDLARLRDEAERVFRLNEVEDGEVYYHMPSCHHYPSLFAWDSCFHAVAMTRLDPERAARELETLMAQVEEGGRLPHEVLLPNRYSHRWMRGLQTKLVRWEYDGRGASFMIDPPVFGYAALRVFQATGDLEWLRGIWKNLVLAMDYLFRERALGCDGLICIFHPWESGTDMSPQFFSLMGIDGRRGLKDSWRAYLKPTALYVYNFRRGWDPAELLKAERFVARDLTVNSLAIRSCLSLSRLASELGSSDQAEKYACLASRLARAMDELCWDEREGLYFPLVGGENPVQVKVPTAASLLPLFGGLCEAGKAKRLVEEHLLNQREFWQDHGVPFNPHDRLVGVPEWREDHLWSGHCIWINFCWMLCLGLLEHEYVEEARALAARVIRMVLREGFFEFYDSRTGQGKRIRDFCWPALAMDMAAFCFPEEWEDSFQFDSEGGL